MYEKTDIMARIAANRPELADLLVSLVEEGDPCALPLIFAPDLVRLLYDLDSPGEMVSTVLAFVQGLQYFAQIRYEEMEGSAA